MARNITLAEFLSCLRPTGDRQATEVYIMTEEVLQELRAFNLEPSSNEQVFLIALCLELLMRT